MAQHMVVQKKMEQACISPSRLNPTEEHHKHASPSANAAVDAAPCIVVPCWVSALEKLLSSVQEQNRVWNPAAASQPPAGVQPAAAAAAAAPISSQPAAPLPQPSTSAASPTAALVSPLPLPSAAAPRPAAFPPAVPGKQAQQQHQPQHQPQQTVVVVASAAPSPSPPQPSIVLAPPMGSPPSALSPSLVQQMNEPLLKLITGCMSLLMVVQQVRRTLSIRSHQSHPGGDILCIVSNPSQSQH